MFAAADLCLASIQLTYWLLWAGSLALSVTLVVLLYARWGHSRPLHKCAVLSLIVHLILAFLTMTVRIVSGDGGGGGGGGPPIHVRIVAENLAPSTPVIMPAVAARPAAIQVAEVAAPPLLAPPPPAKHEPKATPEPEKAAPKLGAPELIADAPPKHTAKKVVKTKPKPKAKTLATTEMAKTPTLESANKSAAPPTATAAPPTPAEQKVTPAPAFVARETAPVDQSPLPAPAQQVAESAPFNPANPYSMRNAPGRLGLIAGQGGNAQTEAAVAAALKWLAENQSKDGRWDAVQFGAGQEEMTLGQNRGGAGRNADTGITSLALLAFLGAGHSHLQGEYQDNVRRGLDYLLRTQAADGSLFGDATLYAQMYCHSMATFALAETEAMTRDRRIEAAVVRAVNFSLAAQNPTTGGWRYRPGDTGDTSQLGWQIMALASAQRAGINVPESSWKRVQTFLRGVERGNSGGLASYRTDSPMSTSMTAEALYCRLMLEEVGGLNLDEPAAAEATTQLLASPPIAERFNLYYWYYATLALHHRQHANDTARAAWRSWNDAITISLTKSQLTDGNDAGSWNSNTIWGGYGGRIYTTAMATMCLEVYYRYAPQPPRGPAWSAARPQEIRTR